MKKLLIIVLLFISSLSFAQKNVVKMGVFGVTYGDFALSYERLVTLKSSLNFTLGYLSPKNSIVGSNYTTSTSGGVGLRELYDGFHTSLDYRFYVGKKEAPKGFYLAPYLRYAGFKFLMNDEIDNVYFDVNSRISTVGLGFQMGYHWIVYDKISIDWYFLGIGVEYVMPKLVYTTDNAYFDYSTIVDNVKSVFDGWDYFQKRLKTNPSKDNMTAKLPTFFPGIKTGLSIGYAF
jgi:hypothetical protein